MKNKILIGFNYCYYINIDYFNDFIVNEANCNYCFTVVIKCQ